MYGFHIFTTTQYRVVIMLVPGWMGDDLHSYDLQKEGITGSTNRILVTSCCVSHVTPLLNDLSKFA